jgi:hypothetical protein
MIGFGRKFFPQYFVRAIPAFVPCMHYTLNQFKNAMTSFIFYSLDALQRQTTGENNG